MITVIGQPPRPVRSVTALMYTLSMSGRSSRSTLIAMKCWLRYAAISSSSNDSRSIT
jgi:hypothetical protein